jgi:hypothetical protein
MGGVIIALLVLAAAVIAAWFLVVRASQYLGLPRRGRGETGERNPTSIRKN